jgi:hypothetical protein
MRRHNARARGGGLNGLAVVIFGAAVAARLLADDVSLRPYDGTDRRVCDESGGRVYVERDGAFEACVVALRASVLL